MDANSVRVSDPSNEAPYGFRVSDLSSITTPFEDITAKEVLRGLNHLLAKIPKERSHQYPICLRVALIIFEIMVVVEQLFIASVW